MIVGWGNVFVAHGHVSASKQQKKRVKVNSTSFRFYYRDSFAIEWEKLRKNESTMELYGSCIHSWQTWSGSLIWKLNMRSLRSCKEISIQLKQSCAAFVSSKMKVLCKLCNFQLEELFYVFFMVLTWCNIEIADRDVFLKTKTLPNVSSAALNAFKLWTVKMFQFRVEFHWAKIHCGFACVRGA